MTVSCVTLIFCVLLSCSVSPKKAAAADAQIVIGQVEGAAVENKVAVIDD